MLIGIRVIAASLDAASLSILRHLPCIQLTRRTVLYLHPRIRTYRKYNNPISYSHSHSHSKRLRIFGNRSNKRTRMEKCMTTSL